MNNASPGRSRTILLSILVVLAVIVVALIGTIVFRKASEPDASPAATTSSSTSASSSTTSSETSTTTSTTTPPPTKSTPAPGSVTYQLTGRGDVVALTFTDQSGSKLVPAQGAPWSQQTTVSGTHATLDAIVIRGPVTCTILHGEDLISSSTSNGGPLHCGGTIPR